MDRLLGRLLSWFLAFVRRNRMLIITAWRNLWRNKRRTLILIAAITVGLWAVLLSMAFFTAWLADTVKNSVSTTVGHVQVQAPGYYENPQVKRNLPYDPALVEKLALVPGSFGACARIQGQVLLSNAEKAEMGLAVGTDPSREKTVSVIPDSLVEGRWLEAGENGKIVVGQAFLEKFKTKIGRRVILRGNDANGEIADMLFHIVGAYRSTMKPFDERTVYITLSDAQRFFALDGKVTEYVAVAQAPRLAEELKLHVQQATPAEGHKVTSWQEQLPLVVKIKKMTDSIVWYFYSFFYIAMAFGIANAMLMVVHERTREIGMMLALGVRRITILGVVMFEALLLALTAAVVGNGLGYLIVLYFTHYGLNLSAWAEGMNQWGMSAVMYPYLTVNDIITATVATVITAFIMTLYPAWKASRLRPVKALRVV
ncbi:MAG: ABC transporter permease [Alphaproteobacteria bacterium]